MIPKVCNACGHDPELDSAEVRALRTAVKLAESALATAREEGRAAGAEEMRERAATLVGAGNGYFIATPRHVLASKIRSLATTPAPEPAPRRQRRGCKDLDSQWPGIDGQPRGPTLCVLYPDCECGEQDRAGEPAAPTPGEGKP